VTKEKQELFRYRLSRAHEVLEDAELMLNRSRLTSATNRTYYAMFYAAIALLATRDLSSSRHSGVIALLNDHFVRAGVFPAELAAQLARAFDLRDRTDYDDYVQPEADAVREMFENARRFVAAVEGIIQPLFTQIPEAPES
jgi:uncharacterized protein (UPF0332 family)